MPLPLFHRAALDVIGRTTRMYMQPGEQDVLVALIKSVAARTMVEIGVNVGITAKAVLANVNSIHRYVGVDIDGDYQFELPAQKSERPVHPGLLVKGDPRFELILRDSYHDAGLPTEADVIFIDGDHGHRAVTLDSFYADKIVTPGGIIIWHDYNNPTVEVTEVLDDLHDEGGWDIMHVAGTWLAFAPR